MSNLQNRFKIFLEKIKKGLFKIAEFLHRKIFGHEMGDEMRGFLGNLSISFFAGSVSSLILFLVSVFAGRFLGPVDYGKYALYVALFSFFAIFLSFGLETTVVRLAAKTNNKGKKIILSTFLIFFFVNSVFWSLVFFLFSDYIAGFFGVPKSFIFFAAFFSITNSLGVTFENFLKLLDQFVFTGVLRIVQSFLLLILVIASHFLFEELFSLKCFIIFYLVTSIAALITLLFKIRVYFVFVFDKNVLKKLLFFSSFLFLSVISGYLIQSGTNILVDKFIGSRQLGFYNAYYVLSMAVTGQFIVFFISAYFPALAKSKNKKSIIRKIDRMVPMIAIPWIISGSLVMFFGIKLYGSSYLLDFRVIFLFSLYSLFYLCGVLYGYIVISHAKSKMVRNMYLIWFLVVCMYFIGLFIVSLFISITIQIVLLMQVIVFGINVFLNRYYCYKIIAK
jgi:O-antigen/teichoic acid export membrane protein